MFERFNEAAKFAIDAHAGQIRKMKVIPYILHPMEVANIIATVTEDEDLMIAGLLHDTVEDCDVDPRIIREKFGSRVAALVQSESEDKLSDRPASETWLERKQESLLMLEHTKNLDVKILWLGDKLSNIRSFYRSYLEQGDKMWLKLNQSDPKMQHWYYQSVAEYLKEDLGSTAAYREYTELVLKLFGRYLEGEDK